MQWAEREKLDIMQQIGARQAVFIPRKTANPELIRYMPVKGHIPQINHKISTGIASKNVETASSAIGSV